CGLVLCRKHSRPDCSCRAIRGQTEYFRATAARKYLVCPRIADCALSAKRCPPGPFRATWLAADRIFHTFQTEYFRANAARKCLVCPRIAAWADSETPPPGFAVPRHSTSSRSNFFTPSIPRFAPSSLARVHSNHTLDRPPAHGAEPHFIARKHDTVLLRPIVPASLVHRAFVSAHHAGLQQSRGHRAFLAKQILHFLFRPMLCPNLPPSRLNPALLRFELLLRPRRRQRRTRRNQILPLGGVRISGRIRLP